MIESKAADRTARLSAKDLFRTLARPPLSDRRFWAAQAMVAVVFFVHLGADFAFYRALDPIPGFV